MLQHKITRVKIENYKSIGKIDVKLGDINFIVGQNAAGKSNFLDALHFLSDAIVGDMATAIRKHGGIASIKNHSAKSDDLVKFYIEFKIFNLKNTLIVNNQLEFRISIKDHIYEIEYEKLNIEYDFNEKKFKGLFNLKNGKFITTNYDESSFFPNFNRKLYETKDLRYTLFSSLYLMPSEQNTIRKIIFCNFNPHEMKRPQLSESAHLLNYEGNNIAEILKSQPEQLPKILDWVRKIIPQIQDIEVKNAGGYDHLIFKQKNSISNEFKDLYAHQISDGTMRVLGAIVAINAKDINIVAIEEPETSLHPWAVRQLRNAMIEASANRQIIITCHSPDLLDDESVRSDDIIFIEHDGINTIANKISKKNRKMVKEKLATIGELLRDNQLESEK